MNDMAKRLMTEDGTAEITEGSVVRTFRGDRGILTTIRPNEGQNGKVYVKLDGRTWEQAFYPSVIGGRFVDMN